MAESKQIQFEQDEFKKLTDFRNNKNSIYNQLGQLRIEKEARMNEIQTLEQQLIQQHIELNESEQAYYTELNKKYGDGNYDLATNIFTPVEKN